MFSEQWRHAPLFTEQWTQFGRAESSKLLLFISLRLEHNKLGDPYTLKSFFFLIKYLLSVFLKKRNIYFVAKRAMGRCHATNLLPRHHVAFHQQEQFIFPFMLSKFSMSFYMQRFYFIASTK